MSQTKSLRGLWAVVTLSYGCSGAPVSPSSGAGTGSDEESSASAEGGAAGTAVASSGYDTGTAVASSGYDTSDGAFSSSSGDDTLDGAFSSSSEEDGTSTSSSSSEAVDTTSSAEASGTTGPFEEVPEEEALFIPQQVSNTLRDGAGDVWLTLFASTLLEGPNGLEYYTAIRNDGEIPVCLGSVTTYFVDDTDTLVATYGTGLYLRNYYRHENGEGTYTVCIAPGEVAMSAVTENLPEEIVLSELWYLKHEFPGHLFYDIAPVESPIAVSDVNAVPSGDGGGFYTGTYTNRLDEPLSAANVAIFPVNRVGRPLGVATSRTDLEIPPGGTWTFETTTVPDFGDGFVTFP